MHKGLIRWKQLFRVDDNAAQQISGAGPGGWAVFKLGFGLRLRENVCCIINRAAQLKR
jgi:hypothetical protein